MTPTELEQETNARTECKNLVGITITRRYWGDDGYTD